MLTINAQKSDGAMHFYSLINSVMSAGWPLAGSRRALGNYAKYKADIERSDYDFICIDNKENIALLHALGFICRNDIQERYKDISTVSVYERTIGDTVVQVATKKQEHWSSLIKFWDFLTDNPEIFVNSFWKRKVKKEDIRINIDFMITRVFNYD